MSERLKPKHVARRLGVSTRTLRNYREQGIGPSHITLPSGHARYPTDAVDAYLATHCDQPKDQEMHT